MKKKKLRDCTYGEVKKFCKAHNICEKCPLYGDYGCSVSEIPLDNTKEILDIEIELPDNEH